MELVATFANSSNAAVIAPAGCGKTHLIANAVTNHNSGRELILTHTNAGVYTIRQRLRRFNADPKSYSVDTIAGWALRFSAAYPAISGLLNFNPLNPEEWENVYVSAVRLLENRVIQDVIKRSYTGIYVDEYQDCLKTQHQIVRQLAELRPCRIVGDPLQSIFGFGRNQLADWDSEVMTSFSVIGEMDTPWRWIDVNRELGKWLQMVRVKLLAGETINLRSVPDTITWIPSSEFIEQSQKSSYIGHIRNETTCLIGRWENSCHSLARRGGGLYTCLEPIECQALFDWASRIDTSTGITRSQSVCDFAGECFSNVKPHIKKLMQTLNEKKRKSNATPSPAGVLFQQIVNEGTLAPVLPALEAIRKMEKVNLYRGELYHEMCRSLKEHLSNPTVTLKECALVVRERTRRLGRHFPNKTVGTTLLIKGMEFDHCMVMDAHSHDKNNLYVALTRGSRTLTIVSKEPELKPTS